MFLIYIGDFKTLDFAFFTCFLTWLRGDLSVDGEEMDILFFSNTRLTDLFDWCFVNFFVDIIFDGIFGEVAILGVCLTEIGLASCPLDEFYLTIFYILSLF